MKSFVFILFLTTQICAANINLKYEPETVELSVEKDVRLIQLSISNDNLFPQIRKFGVNQKIKLKGKLFVRQSYCSNAVPS